MRIDQHQSHRFLPRFEGFQLLSHPAYCPRCTVGLRFISLSLTFTVRSEVQFLWWGEWCMSRVFEFV